MPTPVTCTTSPTRSSPMLPAAPVEEAGRLPVPVPGAAFKTGREDRSAEGLSARRRAPVKAFVTRRPISHGTRSLR